MVMVKLRGHHLICLHFFKGEGYSEGFVKNLCEVVERAENGKVEIVTGGDDVCAACPSFKNNRCMHNGDNEEEMRQLDALALLLFDPKQRHLEWAGIRKLLPSIIGEWQDNACNQCEWLRVCETTQLWSKLAR